MCASGLTGLCATAQVAEAAIAAHKRKVNRPSSLLVLLISPSSRGLRVRATLGQVGQCLNARRIKIGSYSCHTRSSLITKRLKQVRCRCAWLWVVESTGGLHQVVNS